MTITRAVEPCISDDTDNPKTFSQIAHSFNANAVVALTMTAWVLADCQQWITDNANNIATCNSNIDDLSDRIDNIEEDIALLQNI